MAETIGNIQVVASINTKDYDAGKKKIEKGNSDLESGADKTSKGFSAAWIGAIAGVAATLTNTFLGAIKSSVDGAIKRVDTLNNSVRTFDNMGIGAADSAKAMDDLQKSIKGLPTPLDQAVSGMTALTATYGDISKGQRIFSALNNAILGFGGSSDMVNNAIQQLSQLPMDGPLDAQTWNSLRNSGITPVLVAMARDSGMSVSKMKEAFGDGTLTVQDFTDKLLKLNEEGGGGLKSLEQIAKDSTNGIGTGMANLNTAITRGVANIIQELGSGQIAGVFNNMSDIVDSTSKKAVASLAGVKQYISTTLIPIIKGIGDDLSSGDFTNLGKKIGEGIGNFVSFVVVNTESIMKWFQGINWGQVGIAVGGGAFAFTLGLITGLFSTDFLTTAFNFIKDNWASVLIAVLSVALAPAKLLAPIGKLFQKIFSKVPFGKGIINGFKGIAGWIRSAFEPIRSAIGSIVNTMIIKPFGLAVGTIGNVLKTVWMIVTTPFRLAIDYIALLIRNIPQMFINAFNMVMSALNLSFSIIRSLFTGLFNAIKVIFQPLGSFFQGVWNGITTSLGGLINVIRSFFTSAWNSVVSLWSSAGGFFSSVWNMITSAFSLVTTFFRSIFQGAWDNIRSIFSGVGSFFSGVWNTIVSIFGNVGTAVGNAIGNSFKSVINGVLRGAVNIINGFIRAINSAIDVVNNIPNVNVSKLGELGVPMLAKGGVVSSPTLAMIGEGSESEAVIPLSKLDAMLNNDGEGSKKEWNIQEININNEVDGEKWLRRLTENQEIVSNGLVPQQKYMGAN